MEEEQNEVGYSFKLSMYVTLSDKPLTNAELYRRLAEAAVDQLSGFDVDTVADLIVDIEE